MLKNVKYSDASFSKKIKVRFISGVYCETKVKIVSGADCAYYDCYVLVRDVASILYRFSSCQLLSTRP